MSQTIVSVIIPVYNVEKYLRECIDSVLAQTYTDFELLLIDDGSTDSSGAICDKYAEQDSRVKVFHKPNGGVSSARNLGLDNAKGEYLIFLDADDYWCELTAMEQMYNVAVKNSIDIVRGEYVAVDINGRELCRNKIDAKKKISQDSVLDSISFLDNVVQREFFLPLCLIKRDIIGELRFNTKRSFLEDLEFFIQILLQPLKCYYIPVYFYAYRKHALSASNNYNKKRLADAFDISRLYIELSLSANDEKLSSSFIVRGWDYYWLTLRTIATEDILFVNRKSLSCDLSLRKLRDDLSNVILDINVENKWLVKLSPCMVVYYFRIRYIIGKFLK